MSERGRGGGRGGGYRDREAPYRDYRDDFTDRRPPPPPPLPAVSSLPPPPIPREVRSGTLPPRPQRMDADYYQDEERSTKRKRYEGYDDGRRPSDLQQKPRPPPGYQSNKDYPPPPRRDSGPRNPPRDDGYDVRRASNVWVNPAVKEKDDRERNREVDRPDRDREEGEVYERYRRGASRRDSVDTNTTSGTGGTAPTARPRSRTPRTPVAITAPAQVPGAAPPSNTPASAAAAAMPTLAPAATRGAGGAPAVSGPRPPELASAILNASFLGIKLQQAEEEYSKAASDDAKHAEHYAMFPQMRERYGGILQQTTLQLDKIKSEFHLQSERMNQELQAFAVKQLAVQDSEDALRFSQSLARELGASTLEQYVQGVVAREVHAQVQKHVEAQVQAQLSAYVPPQRLEAMNSSIIKLQDDTRRLNERDKVVAVRNDLTALDSRITIAQRIAENNNKAASEISHLNKSLETLRIGMNEMNEELVQTDRKVEERIKETLKESTASLEGLVTRVDKLKKTVDQHSKTIPSVSKEASDAKKDVAELKGSKGSSYRSPESMDEGAHAVVNNGRYITVENLPKHLEGNYATAETLEELKNTFKSTLDSMKDFVDESLEEVTNTLIKVDTEMKEIGDRVATVQQNTSDQQISNQPVAGGVTVESLRAAFNECKQAVMMEVAQIQQAGLRSLQDKTDAKLTQSTDAAIKLQATFNQHVNGFSQSLNGLNQHILQNAIAPMDQRMQQSFAAHQKSIDALMTAFKQLDERQSEWSSKELCEKLIPVLLKHNPTLFTQSVHLQTLNIGQSKLQQAVGELQRQLKEQTDKQKAVEAAPIPAPKPGGTGTGFTATPSGRGTPAAGGGDQPAANGAGGTTGNLGDLMKVLQSQGAELDELKQRLEEHISVYHQKMKDIREWTINATKRMQENNDQVGVVQDEIRRLNELLLSSERPRQGSASVAPSPVDRNRWKAVAPSTPHQGHSQTPTEQFRSLPATDGE